LATVSVAAPNAGRSWPEKAIVIETYPTVHWPIGTGAATWPPERHFGSHRGSER
jgi:hypothetical protein